MANTHQNTNASTPSPNEVPVSQPPYTGHQDHSFTLQAIMEMNKTLGQLCEKTDSLKTQINNFDTRLATVESTVSGISQKMYAAGIILIILLAIGGFIVNKAWDLMADLIKPTIEQSFHK